MIVNADCRRVLVRMIERGEQVDSIVTDPPYGLVSVVKRFGKGDSAPAKSDGATGVYRRASAGFMGQEWDGSGIEYDPAFWRLCMEVLKPGGHLVAFAGTKTMHRIASGIERGGFEVRDTLMWLYGTGFPKSHDQGDGWGSALKPAWEPITLARKPVIGSLKENHARYQVGALNIDASKDESGRWPANVLTDGGLPGEQWRYFYTTKASKSDRNVDWQGNRIPVENRHPTVKPTDLMRWLVTLVTPPGGVVLDPFAGSGSTGKAARAAGFRFIGIEADPKFADIAWMRYGGSDFEAKMAHLRWAIRENEEARNG